METHANEVTQAGSASPSQTPTNGSIRHTPTGGPTTRDGAEYLQDLRAMRRAEPKGGRRIFNPDETPEEAEERIREALAGLQALSEMKDDEPDEAPEIWDQVMEAVKRPRLQLHDVDLDTSDP